ncbi:MAG: hypothetical protein ABR961_14180 [Thermoanaerobaculaceae bacterium]|jgi:hypothetical protein
MATKLLMLVVEESKKEQVEVFLDRAGVLGYTEIPHALGVGATGPRLGSRAFPKTSAVIFTVLEEDALQRVVDGIRAYCGECGERLKMLAWDAQDIPVTVGMRGAADASGTEKP